VSDKSALDKYFELSRRLYNAILNETLIRFNLMRESKIYQKAKKEVNPKIKKEMFYKAEEIFRFREYDLCKFATKLMVNEYFELGGHIKSKLVKRAYSAVNQLRFGEAKKINFISKGDLHSIEGANNLQNIRYRNGFIEFIRLKMMVKIKNNDIFARTALNDRIKYSRLLSRNNKYYVQIIFEGMPPNKICKETGEIKGKIGNGKVGIDIGTQTIAYSSKYDVKLLELASDVQNIEGKKRILLRAMDRSRRATNLNKYNKDNTINTNEKGKWVKSNHYIKLQNKLKKEQNKQADVRRQSHNKLANQIISLGNEFYVETMDFKNLQAKSINNGKRFGKSLGNKAPSMFLTILNNKLKWNNTKIFKINTYKIKASQYNHITNEFKKKELCERWNNFGEYKIQRDLYSAFLIMNVRSNLEEIDREMCFYTFNNFKQLHDKEILRIKNNKHNVISSIGI
jgi:hypothetical protein